MPSVLVRNDTSLGLIRQGERAGYEMGFAIRLGFGENDRGVDSVKARQALGGDGRAVTRPEGTWSAFAWAVARQDQ